MSRLLSARDVSVAYEGRQVLWDVSFDLTLGEFVGLIGPNGAGKTTLLRALARLADYSGLVTLRGEDVRLIDRRRLSKEMAYLAQGHAASWPLEARRIVALGRLPHVAPWHRPNALDDKIIDEAMARADVARFALQDVDTLSAGERARVMLARALAVKAPILLADEPIASLDPYHQLQIVELLRDLAREGATVVMVTHDLTLAARYCDRLMLLSEGRLRAEGGSEVVLSEATLAEVYGVEALRSAHDDESYVLPWRRVDEARLKPRPTSS